MRARDSLMTEIDLTGACSRLPAGGSQSRARVRELPRTYRSGSSFHPVPALRSMMAQIGIL